MENNAAPNEIASTKEGIKAFTILQSGDRSLAAWRSLQRIAKSIKDSASMSAEEVGAAIESFIVDGGEVE